MKNKIKIILILIITIIITSSITAYATYNYLAKDIKYTKADGTEIDLEKSLNELYSFYNKELKYIDRVVATKNETSSYQSISNSKELEKGKYFIIIVRSNRNDSGAGNYTKKQIHMVLLQEAMKLNFYFFQGMEKEMMEKDILIKLQCFTIVL